MEDYLVVFNINNPDYVHRIELGPPERRIRIEQTQITDTDDLFAMIHIDDRYKLFKIDLSE